MKTPFQSHLYHVKFPPKRPAPNALQGALPRLGHPWGMEPPAQQGSRAPHTPGRLVALIQGGCLGEAVEAAASAMLPQSPPSTWRFP